MKKITPTEQEIKEKERIKEYNKAHGKLKASIKKYIKEFGIRHAELIIEFILANRDTKLPSELISFDETIQLYSIAIEERKKELAELN